jgi:large subunit ribosomal protein L15
MRLNTLKPAAGSKPTSKRLGRGIGSGLGKTSGKGHKGQHARAGGYHKVGFEGGQMPIQRRMPKLGFNSAIARVTAEVRLSELGMVAGDIVDMAALQAADVLSAQMRRAKIIASGTVDRAFTVRGLRVTKGAKAAIEAAGGKIEG